jgi:hypothetical protein
LAQAPLSWHPAQSAARVTSRQGALKHAQKKPNKKAHHAITVGDSDEDEAKEHTTAKRKQTTKHASARTTKRKKTVETNTEDLVHQQTQEQHDGGTDSEPNQNEGT